MVRPVLDDRTDDLREVEEVQHQCSEFRSPHQVVHLVLVKIVQQSCNLLPHLLVLPIQGDEPPFCVEEGQQKDLHARKPQFTNCFGEVGFGPPHQPFVFLQTQVGLLGEVEARPETAEVIFPQGAEDCLGNHVVTEVEEPKTLVSFHDSIC